MVMQYALHHQCKKMTIDDIITHYTPTLDRIDSELIVAHVLKKDRVFVIAHGDMCISESAQSAINHLCTKRASGYPLAYITGQKDFFGRTFCVSEDTLIPRDETEILIASVINTVDSNALHDVLLCDIGTGSGIIPITLFKELKQKNINPSFIASDIAKDALDITRKNMHIHNTPAIMICVADLLDNALINAIKQKEKEHTIITANLPYVDKKKKTALLQKPESRALQYEPQIALWSDDHGTEHYKKLIQQTITLRTTLSQTKSITSFYEIDPDQRNDLQKYILHNAPHSTISLFTDLSQKDRVLQWTLY